MGQGAEKEGTFNKIKSSKIVREDMRDIDKDIIEKASKGDLEAFEHIYKETIGFVYNVSLRVVYDCHDAEDVAQKVFVNIYDKLKDFRFQSSFKTWIYRIAVNCAIDHARKASREKDRIKAYGREFKITADLNQSDQGELGYRAECAGQLLDQLSADQKACLVLRSVEGLSYKEIADTLKIKVNTVRTRLKRAREKLVGL
jgi:RNA polymerase sigma-70 factor (ECF subfamily)